MEIDIERQAGFKSAQTSDPATKRVIASIAEELEVETPWSLDSLDSPSAATPTENRPAEETEPEPVAEQIHPEARWTLDDDDQHPSRNHHPVPALPAHPPKGDVPETPWSLDDALASDQGPSHPGSFIGMPTGRGSGSFSQPTPARRGLAKCRLDPNDPSTFGPFAISNQRSNLIIGIREKKPPLASFLASLPLPASWKPRAPPPDDPKYYSRPAPEKGAPHRSYRISFAELQRIRLRKLQCKLVKHVVDMRFGDAEPAGWEADLQAYTAALKDYDYMLQSAQSLRDNFLATGERLVDHLVISTMVESSRGDDPLDADDPEHLYVAVAGPWEGQRDTVPIGGTRSENRAKSRAIELRDNGVMAALGGVFLVAPMWLMVLRNTVYTGLVTTTVCVAVFGGVMTALLGKPHDVLSSTAAYAAVLVVFVGLSNSGDGAGAA